MKIKIKIKLNLLKTPSKYLSILKTSYIRQNNNPKAGEP